VRQPPTVPSNVKVDSDMPSVSGPPEALNFPNVPIKTEGGGYAPPVSTYPQAQTVNGGGYAGYEHNTQLAQQRAAALVQQRVQQHGNVHQQNFPNLAQQGHHPQMPMQGQQQRMMAPQHQQQRPPQQQQQQHMQQQQRPTPQGHIYTSQTDGSGDALADWEALKAARATDAVDRMAADDSMRARIDAMAMRQDSGLMVPLDSMPKGKKRRAAVRVLQNQDAEATSRTPGSAGFDAAADDVEPTEDPEDAINSDLDDSEDELNDGDNSDDDMVDYMLCTYDKVQRVKNKWKCTLKDGILTTNKKE
jgi:transcription initiation factor TFIIA large subunit